MKSSVRFQVLQGMEAGYDAGTGFSQGRSRAPLEARRAQVLSFEQIVAGTSFLRRAAHPLTVVPVRPVAPARVEAAPQPAVEELARDPLAHPVSPARPARAAQPLYEFVPEAGECEETGEREKVKEEPIVARREVRSEIRPEIRSVAEVSLKQELVVEPVEPAAEPRHRGSLHGGVENPVRSMLSPSQRAASRRPETRLNRDGRTTYVTYTVDGTGKQ